MEEQIAPSGRVELPSLEGDALDGATFDSRDYLGKVLVVNVWGSWCPPCLAEAPGLRQVWEESSS